MVLGGSACLERDREAEGAHERAQFWFLMLILLADINSGRVDPDAYITLH